MSKTIRAVETEEEAPELTPGDGQLIYVLMSRVMSDIGFIAKGRKNIQQGYTFRGIDDVFSALQPALIKHGVFFVPEVLKSEQIERETAKGGRLIYTILLVAYTFYAPDGSSVHTVVVGEAMDSGDKSSNKAMSAALKYAVLQIFCVPTEATDDADYDTPPPTKPAQKAVAASVGKKEHVVDPQTPEQEERDALKDFIMQGCQHLNTAKDDINWTPKTLTNFINERFQVTEGLDSLSVEQMKTMKAEMSSRASRLDAKDLGEDEPQF